MIYFTTIKQPVISIYTNPTGLLWWWYEDFVCVCGNWSTRRKPMWSNRWQLDLPTHDTRDWTQTTLVLPVLYMTTQFY